MATSGDEENIRQVISQGGLHVDMPAWKEKLSPSDVDILAKYVVDPGSVPEVKQLFEENCASCHGGRIPSAPNVDEAKNIIEQGGVHQTMPVWGEILTPDQLDALVSYTLSASKGTPIELGRNLYAQSCAACHGDFGEGGANPTRPGDIIAPISSAEYLATRDDITLQSTIAQGQPNIGMSPFGTAFGLTVFRRNRWAMPTLQ